MGGIEGIAAAIVSAVLLALAPLPAGAIPGDQGDGVGASPALDTTPPDTKVTKVRVRRRTVKIVFASTEPGGSFRCNLDSQPLTRCSSPLKLRRLKPGRHRVRLTAIDAAGNADPTGATARFRIRKRHHHHHGHGHGHGPGRTG